MNFTANQTDSSSIFGKIRGAIARILNFTPGMPSDDVRVQRFQSPNGCAQWQVYNASVHQFERLSSEDEVMEWIEESYHHTGEAARQFWFFL